MQGKQWKSSVAAAAVLMVCQSMAWGAGLGKLVVNSSLGQPLNAAIEVILTDPNEFKNLHAHLASSDAFRQANLEVNSTLQALYFLLEKNADGTVVLHVKSDKPVQDTFLDMIVELDWGSGQMLREYTLLLDPPGMKSAAQLPPNLVITPASVGVVQPQTVQPVFATPSPAVQPVTGNAAVPTASEQATHESSVHVIHVKSGMTLSGVSNQIKPEGVHLEQMLVGLYQANPHAFGGNMNRLKSGQILRIPSQDELASISETAAKREVALQAEDWHAYRQKLAGNVEAAPVQASNGKEAGGMIAPAVQDKSPIAPTTSQGVLKLSKGSASTAHVSANNTEQMAQDDTVAKQKELQEANDRKMVLEKNRADTQKLLDLKNQQLASSTQTSLPAASAQPPVTIKPKHHAIVEPVAPPAVTPSWYQLIDPLYMAAAGGVLALGLTGWLIARSRRRRTGLSKFENSILTSVESKPNTVYNTQSGESVNTSNTSFLTDFSQSGLGSLDTHDVDPIAEAEVYMAYGRDVQAEEILKEAMSEEPDRHEIKLKLLEIYAGRSNLPAFEQIATELYSALGTDTSSVWQKAAEMGRKLDPHNPLYGGSDIDVPIREESAEAAAPHEIFAFEAVPAVDQEIENKKHAYQPVHSDVTDEAPAFSAHTTPELNQDIYHDEVLDFNIEFPSHEKIGSLAAQKPEDESLVAIPLHDEVGVSDLSWDFVDSDEQHAITINESETEMDSPVLMELPLIPESVHYPVTDDAVTEDMGISFDMDEPLTPQPDVAVGEGLGRQGIVSGMDQHKGEIVHNVHEEETVAPIDVDSPMMLDFSGIDLNLDTPIIATNEAEQASTSGHEDEQPVAAVVTHTPEMQHIEAVLSDNEQEVKTKFELAQVYLEMGDDENAREILQEVINEGNAQQQSEAAVMLQQIRHAEH